MDSHDTNKTNPHNPSCNCKPLHLSPRAARMLFFSTARPTNQSAQSTSGLIVKFYFLAKTKLTLLRRISDLFPAMTGRAAGFFPTNVQNERRRASPNGSEWQWPVANNNASNRPTDNPSRRIPYSRALPSSQHAQQLEESHFLGPRVPRLTAVCFPHTSHTPPTGATECRVIGCEMREVRSREIKSGGKTFLVALHFSFRSLLFSASFFFFFIHIYRKDYDLEFIRVCFCVYLL